MTSMTRVARYKRSVPSAALLSKVSSTSSSTSSSPRSLMAATGRNLPLDHVLGSMGSRSGGKRARYVDRPDELSYPGAVLGFVAYSTWVLTNLAVCRRIPALHPSDVPGGPSAHQADPISARQ